VEGQGPREGIREVEWEGKEGRGRVRTIYNFFFS
jgi:hypothetical protein